ncbi:prealbumin-like fold domain-containing protein, partial [Rhodovulum adriaticum]|uniref:prealbumin-like fold domain-containing protein n=1 Tax=Rhodovulum adriaticum TaxID=35804 RepID=UPI0019066A50
TINKVDENKSPLEGAEFRITSDNGYDKTIKGTDITKFTFENLTSGKYKIEEITTPEGFKKPTKFWEFTVTEDESGQLKIDSPDFPMSVSTDAESDMKGDFPDPNKKEFDDLVRNEDPSEIDLMNGTTKVGSISKKITKNLGNNRYEMEIIIQAVDKLSNVTLQDFIGPNFNLVLGEDEVFAREDYSLTASDGSFYYIENVDGTEYKGTYGGRPFATDRVLSGADLTYSKSNDSLAL